MVDFKLSNSYSPMLFTSPDYELVVMPMLTSESRESAEPEQEQAEPAEDILASLSTRRAQAVGPP